MPIPGDLSIFVDNLLLVLWVVQTRDYGICLYLLNRFSEAIPCLEAYIQVRSFSDDFPFVSFTLWNGELQVLIVIFCYTGSAEGN